MAGRVGPRASTTPLPARDDQYDGIEHGGLPVDHRILHQMNQWLLRPTSRSAVWSARKAPPGAPTHARCAYPLGRTSSRSRALRRHAQPPPPQPARPTHRRRHGGQPVAVPRLPPRHTPRRAIDHATTTETRCQPSQRPQLRDEEPRRRGTASRSRRTARLQLTSHPTTRRTHRPTMGAIPHIAVAVQDIIGRSRALVRSRSKVNAEIAQREHHGLGNGIAWAAAESVEAVATPIQRIRMRWVAR